MRQANEKREKIFFPVPVFDYNHWNIIIGLTKMSNGVTKITKLLQLHPEYTV